MRRALALAGLAAGLAAAPARGQEPVHVPADTIPVGEILAPPSDSLPTVVRLPGLEPMEEAGGFPWVAEWPGFHGVTLWRYERTDGAIPAFGLRLSPRDPDRLPEIHGRIGLATTHARAYWELTARERLPLHLPGVLALEATALDRPATFDDWKVSPRENDAATLLVGADLVDWWRERGWRAALAWESATGNRSASVAFLDADQISLPSRDPYVLFGGGDFRANPAVAEGRLHSLTVAWRIDTRNVQSPLLPTPGARILLDAERGGGFLGGEVDFWRIRADLRGAVRFRRDAWWSGRLVGLAGDADGPGERPLPPQRHAMLGGPGSLPGFPAGRFVGSDALQASTAVRLPLPVTDTISLVFLSWHWVAFADAGAVDDLGRWHADVGTGVSGVNIFSYLGIFVAQRVTDLGEPDDGPRLVVSLRRDF